MKRLRLCITSMTTAVFIARREEAADASCADMRSRIRFGIAIAAIIKTMPKAISNSISEKPVGLRNLSLFYIRGS